MRLPDVRRRLRIPLHHHDAEACARTVLTAEVEEWQWLQQPP